MARPVELMPQNKSEVSRFNNRFKKFVGTSPQNYRKLWVGNEQFKNLNHIYDALMRS